MKMETIIGVIAVIYRRNLSKNIEFLLLKHQNTLWTFAGGKVEETDKSILSGLQREIKEELNLNDFEYTLEDTDIVNEFTYGNEKPDRAGKQGITYYYSGKLSPPANPKCQAEILEIKWLSKDEVLKHLSFDDIKKRFLEVYERLESNG